MKCVRPIFTIFIKSFDLPAKVFFKLSIAGSVRSFRILYAAMCIAVGKVSLLDWDLFTSSLGWRIFSLSVSFPPLSKCPYNFFWHFIYVLCDPEVLDASLCLGAIISCGGYFHFPHGIFFNSIFH